MTETTAQRGNRFRIYPTKEQQVSLKRDFRNANFVYNWCLGLRFHGLLLANILNTNFETQDQLNDFVKKKLFFLLSKKNRKTCLPKETPEKDKYKCLIIEEVEKLEYKCSRTKFLCELWNTPIQNIADKVNVWCEEFNLKLVFKKDTKTKIERWFSFGNGEISKRLTELKKDKFSFLNETTAQILNGSLRDADAAFTRFFKGLAKRPKFKRKDSKQSFSVQNNCSKHLMYDTSVAMTRTQNRILESGNKNPAIKILRIPKYKNILIHVHRPITTTIGTVTISLDPTGYYYASFASEEIRIAPKRNVTYETTIGIDYGLKSFIAKDDGTKIEAPDFHESLQKQILFYDRKLAKLRIKNPDWKTSKRYEKIKQKKAKLEAKVANRRNDFQHKVSHELLNPDVSAVGVESLVVRNMVKNRKLSKAISRAAWSEFTRKIEYKSNLRGISVFKADQYYASTHICSNCSAKTEKLSLDVREWTCNNCGTKHDRDHNAAINLKKEAFRIHEVGLKASVNKNTPDLSVGSTINNAH